MGVGDYYTVWLLGAGFSRALGGPLLTDLFRPSGGMLDDALFFPHARYPYLASDLLVSRLFFRAGREEGRWSDAEEFLAFVDSAQRDANGPKKGVLSSIKDRLLSGAPVSAADVDERAFAYSREHFVTNATPIRRALAAECSVFLMDFDDSEEIWHPYRTWASSLDPKRDTVISFNYDLVVEKLAAQEHSKLKVLMPEECPQVASDTKELPQDVVPVLKLHGSVDWRKSESGGIERGDLHNILADENSAPFIAAPGRSKQDAVGELKPLWESARRRLRQAGALVILGYGFPATDTKARTEIQTAFSDGSGTTEIRRIDVVLGPHTARPEARRVEALLETFDTGRRLLVAPNPPLPGNDRVLYLKTHPLWVQDFIFDYQYRTKDVKWEGARFG
jgi:hypothetical protein